MKKITPKKSSLFSILFFLELLSENPEEPNHQDPQNQSKPKHFIRFYSVGVFYLLLSVPTFLCSRTLSTSEKKISVVGWNRQARLNGSPGVQHPHNVNQASEKTSRNYLQHTVRYARVSSHYYKCNPWYHSS